MSILTDVMPFIAQDTDSLEDLEGPIQCSVCLCAIATHKQGVLLTYQGSFYHATCANLWVNLVDNVLPKLKA